MASERCDIPPFGAFAPRALDAALVKATRATGSRWIARRLATVTRHWLARVSGRLVDIENDGVRFRVAVLGNASERNILLLPRFRDRAELAALRRALAEADAPVFVDVGANVGLYALTIARGLPRSGRVVAIEPQPHLFARLTTNAALNGLANITPVERAVGPERSRLALRLSEQNAGQATLVGQSRAQDGKTVEVEVEPLLDILGRLSVARVDALKIDIEGYEDQALVPFIQAAPRDLWPKTLLVEHSPDAWTIDLAQVLADAGYRIEARFGSNRLYRLGEG